MPSFTLADLKQRVWDRVDNNVDLYPASEVTSELNEAICAYNLYTGVIQGYAHVPGYTIANQVVYSVPTGILVAQHVAFEGRTLSKVSIRKISLLRRNWLTETTTATGPVARWVPIGIDTLAIHPADAVGGKDLLVSGIAEPTPLVDDADTITLPDEDAEAIEELAGATIVLKEGGKAFADVSLLYRRFLSTVKQKMLWQSAKLPRYWLLQAAQKAEEA